MGLFPTDAVDGQQVTNAKGTVFEFDDVDGKWFIVFATNVYTQDEVDALLHTEAHDLASHTTKAHSELTDVTANQHHNEAHDLASHSTKAHQELTDYNAEANVKHLTDDQLGALHAIYTLEVHDNDEHNPNYLANVSEDATPEIMINSSLPSDHTAHGTVLIITNAQAFGKAVYVSANNTVALADKDLITTMLAIGISAGTNKVLILGSIRDDNWTWTFNDTIFVGDGGALTNDVSGYTAGDMVQVVGIALNATTVLVKGIDWVEIV